MALFLLYPLFGSATMASLGYAHARGIASRHRGWWGAFVAGSLLVAILGASFLVTDRPDDVTAGAALQGAVMGVIGVALLMLVYLLLGRTVGWMVVRRKADPLLGWFSLGVLWILLAIPAAFALLLIGLMVMDHATCAPDAYECPV